MPISIDNFDIIVSIILAQSTFVEYNHTDKVLKVIETFLASIELIIRFCNICKFLLTSLSHFRAKLKSF